MLVYFLYSRRHSVLNRTGGATDVDVEKTD